MNYEDTVGMAIVEALGKCGNADIESGIGYMFQRPLSDEAKKLLDKIGVTAILAVAEWNARYAARAKEAQQRAP